MDGVLNVNVTSGRDNAGTAPKEPVNAPGTPEAAATPPDQSVADAADASADDAQSSRIDALVAEYQKKYFSGLFGNEDADADAPAAPAAGPEREDVMAQLRDALQQFAQNNSQGQQAAPRQDPTLTEFLAKGDFVGAEQYLTQKATAALMPKVTEQMNAMREEAISRAVTGASAKFQLDTYFDGIMNKSPELAGFRDFIEYKADMMVEAARRANKVRDVSGYVEAKKAAYAMVVEDIRKQIGAVRTKGKSDALKVKEKVLASSPTSGTPAEGQHAGDTAASPRNAMPSVEDYIAMRRQATMKQKGMIRG